MKEFLNPYERMVPGTALATRPVATIEYWTE